jgi:2-polyprenyl-3-methyl-5-hydroxy-6-metoxy-1,4-benzoquinol methylase
MLKILPPKKTARQLAEERLDLLWSQSPKQFDYSRNCREIERIERTWDLIQKIPDLNQKVIVDVGCGTGEIAKRLKKLGATVHALDGSQIPLPHLEKEGITAIHDYLPKTKLNDNFYDLVICTDVIGYLPPQEHRLLMLELSRIVKKEGYVICSTGLDIYTEDPLEIFESLLQTEFVVEEWRYSHHAWHIRMNLWRNNRRFLLWCEKMTKMFQEESGISHAICLAKRKTLF